MTEAAIIMLVRGALALAAESLNYYMKVREQYPGLDWELILADVPITKALREAAYARAVDHEAASGRSGT